MVLGSIVRAFAAVFYSFFAPSPEFSQLRFNEI